MFEWLCSVHVGKPSAAGMEGRRSRTEQGVNKKQNLLLEVSAGYLCFNPRANLCWGMCTTRKYDPRAAQGNRGISTC